MTSKRLLVIVTALALVMVLPLTAQAAPVGKFIMVQGHVDILKQGKLPAAPVKLNDGVEPGDVIRTKSKSKAQVRFVDETTLTLAPESRVAIADYLYDGRQRRATLNVYRGLVHTVVNKILQIQEPDFIFQTHTAWIGVRGTEWYTLIKPISTLVYLPAGRLAAASRNPTNLLLEAGYWVEIFKDRITPPRIITAPDLELLEKLMDSGVPESPDFQVTPEGRGHGTGIPRPPDLERGIPPALPPTLTPPQRPPGPTPGPSITPGLDRITR
ncbi:MAG: FecR domain-containing protein [Deltaproteobacteria bacterium]|nr:FecR domain-containing protein [Deltaproteobacteria bacterium]